MAVESPTGDGGGRRSDALWCRTRRMPRPWHHRGPRARARAPHRRCRPTGVPRRHGDGAGDGWGRRSFCDTAGVPRRHGYHPGSSPRCAARPTSAQGRDPYAEGMSGTSHRTPPVPGLEGADRWGPWSPHGASRGPWRPSRLLLAVALTMFQVLGTLGAAQGQPERRPLDALALALLVAGPVAIAVLMGRVGVVAVTAVVGTVTAAYLVLGYPYGPVVVSLVVVLVASVVTGHRATAWLVAAGVLAAHTTAVILDPARTWSWIGATATLAWTLLLLAFAEVVRVRRERVQTYRRALAEERRRRAGEDRLRIAQDLHDVVAHHMSLINVQASVALHLREQHPEQVDEALRVIKGASKEALTELRSLIDVLRGGDGPAPRPPVRDPRGAGRPRRAQPVCRPRRHLEPHRGAWSPPLGRRGRGLPRRAGGRHQRRPSRRGDACRGHRGAPPAGAGRPRRRRRVRPERDRRARGGTRHPRHARTRHGTGRTPRRPPLAARGPARDRHLPDDGDAS